MVGIAADAFRAPELLPFAFCGGFWENPGPPFPRGLSNHILENI